METWLELAVGEVPRSEGDAAVAAPAVASAGRVGRAVMPLAAAEADGAGDAEDDCAAMSEGL